MLHIDKSYWVGVTFDENDFDGHFTIIQTINLLLYINESCLVGLYLMKIFLKVNSRLNKDNYKAIVVYVKSWWEVISRSYEDNNSVIDVY